MLSDVLTSLSLPMNAEILSKFGKPQLCFFVQNVAQGWSRNLTVWVINRGISLPFSGMRETKAIENKKGKPLWHGKGHGDDFLMHLQILSIMLPSVYICISIGGEHYVLLTSPDNLKYRNHRMNPEPNVVLSNSVIQGTFWTEVHFFTVALSQALLAVSLPNNFVFLWSHWENVHTRVAWNMYFLCLNCYC